MNNRIKELEKQCWYQEPCDFDMREGGLSTLHTVFDRAKFARLIIKECTNIAREADAENVFGAGFGYDIANRIEDYFGVNQ